MTKWKVFGGCDNSSPTSNIVEMANEHDRDKSRHNSIEACEYVRISIPIDSNTNTWTKNFGEDGNTMPVSLREGRTRNSNNSGKF